MKPKYVMFTNNKAIVHVNRIPLIVRFFGEKFVSVTGNEMVWGYKYKSIIYIIGKETITSDFFMLPRGFKLKHILTN